MRRNGRGTGGYAIALTALVWAVAVPGVAFADPKPPARSLEDVHKEVEGLYRQAEAATDAYNAADEATRRQEKSIVEIAKKAATAQERMNRLSNQAGSLARAQYRDGAMPPQVRLFLSASPQTFLDGLALTHKGEAATRGLLAEAAATRKDLDGYAKAASARWKTLDDERKRKETAKQEVESKLSAARALESRLEEKEKERLRQLEEERARQQQKQWLSSDAVKGITLKDAGSATEEGKRAVAFATAQIGKNYVWGAEGPDTFDCSGLTLKAWGAAGRGIPRTSQEQWRQLPKVDVKDMRPGDLIIYFADASHVAMYVGDGTMVHAPRPGRQVTMAGAGSMPILGVVRPG
ncbi:glycoside hydrolase [Streptomyces eurocidicus]|uniref:Cell wall-associated NlpC family hydrolase n=1 Tax=Streptomyces eurocidicus TaxID=66423 RepID=A0A2N8NX27_STREU|nr:C40 family peptidase [Streptomyces eurocidicus]MBB5117852.1 cell wall-associated NlpC family hydrolase [Streptomyces eurocidicus]PNE33325.1 glycoside hydrolase [Streptomyces eurocidicus]